MQVQLCILLLSAHHTHTTCILQWLKSVKRMECFTWNEKDHTDISTYAPCKHGGDIGPVLPALEDTGISGPHGPPQGNCSQKKAWDNYLPYAHIFLSTDIFHSICRAGVLAQLQRLQFLSSQHLNILQAAVPNQSLQTYMPSTCHLIFTGSSDPPPPAHHWNNFLQRSTQNYHFWAQANIKT